MDKQVHILILEDNVSDAELVKIELRRSGVDLTVRCAQDKATFLAALDESIPDVILADYSLPGFDGLAAMALARERFAEIPVVIVSGAIGEETAIEALKAGATDYVLKQRLSRLNPVVQRALREAEELVDRKRAERDLARARSDAEQKAAQLESFISSMADGVALCDADGNTILVNDTGRAILGCPPGYGLHDWACQSLWYALDGELLSLSAEDIPSSRALRGEVVKDARYRVVPPSGKEAVVSASASSVRDSQGAVIGAVSVFRDIADRVEFERARRDLYEREHRIAEMLQQTLIPLEVPREVNGISIATRYQAALREAQVGGDFYDVFKLGEDSLGVLIGDVAGKGLKAAIRVAAVRYSIRSYAYLETSPSKVMTLVNDALILEAADASNALTAFFAVVDTVHGVMTYACAGHEPPIVCSAGNGLEELAVTGAMLGIFKGAVYTERTYRLSAGDSVVMLTDGITEARRNGSALFQKEGVMEVLNGNCSADPEEIADAVLNAATAYAGGYLQDDAAIVVLGMRE